MKVKIICQNIIYLTFPTQKELTLTMCRPQEYYECNSSKLRGKVFTFEDLIDHYIDNMGFLDYFNYWSGFNIPGHILEEFFSIFDLNSREKKLRSVTKHFKYNPYYVIATKKGDRLTLKHELVHAHYYLNPKYKQEANVLVKHMRIGLKKELTNKLRKMGYSKNVMIDEINAYMSTSGIEYLLEDLELDITKNDIKPFVELAERVLRD